MLHSSKHEVLLFDFGRKIRVGLEIDVEALVDLVKEKNLPKDVIN